MGSGTKAHLYSRLLNNAVPALIVLPNFFTFVHECFFHMRCMVSERHKHHILNHNYDELGNDFKKLQEVLVRKELYF